MKLKLDVVLKTPRGEDIMETESVPLTLRNALYNGIMGITPGIKFTAEEKVRRVELAKKVVVGDDQTDFTVEEVAFMKENVDRVYGNPAVYGEVNSLIEA